MKIVFATILFIYCGLHASQDKKITITDFMAAAAHGDARTVEDFLIQNSHNSQRADVTDEYGNTALLYAAYNNRHFVMKRLLLYGANKNYTRPSDRMTALHYAALAKGNDALHILLEKGAQVNVKDKYGCTPLINAAMYDTVKNLQKIKLLIDHGADVQPIAKDLIEYTIHLAQENTFIRSKL